ncbi:hypothetical protein DPMN_141260 [Dreissena polymorpha]|uniref:Uncharacterized protein n=1 Tax=Dreissena polymorpha TaxID=45954 RepID=A0A9D4GC07_DREPO|nr:hypothetical protein DPMN_141260 [Dreissena polymorpha]
MINKRDSNLLRTPDFRALLTTSAPIPNLLDPPPRTAERKTPPRTPEVVEGQGDQVSPLTLPMLYPFKQIIQNNSH